MKNMKWYVENNDFEGAKERFEATSANWKKAWFGVCQTIFNNCKELAKEYILNPINLTIRKVQTLKQAFEIKRVRKNNILVSEDCTSLLDEAKEKCYLFEFFDVNGNSICSKVGTTTRTILERLREELNSSTYKKMGATKAVILRVYDCGKIPAEGLESQFRAEYIRKYPNSFKKNDRFINEKFDLVEADKIANNYLAIA